MAAIHFESDVDNSKLNKGFKESEQTVEDFVKKVEKSGDVLGDFASQSAKQMKESIAIQKNAIRELKQQVKELEEATKSGGGTYKENLQVQGKLASAKKNLAGEEAALIAMQKQQVAGNNVEAESQIPIIGGLKKWMLGLVSVAATMKIGKAIIESTDSATDKFHEVISASTSAVQYFFKAIASGDWSNFMEGMSNAIKGAVEFEEKMERLKDLKNEQLIKSAESRTKIGELRAQTYETTDPKELDRLLGEIIKEQEANFTKEQNLRKLEKDAVLEKAATDNGISKEKIENYIREYSSLEKMLEIGKKYNELEKERFNISANIRSKEGGELAQPRLDEIEKEIDALGEAGKEAGKYVTQIGKITDEVKKGTAEAIAAEERAKGDFDNANRRDKERRKNIRKKDEEDTKAAAKKAKEDAELENRIKATQEAMKSASGQKLKDLAAGLLLLEKELALRNQIIEQENKSAWTDQFKGQSYSQMTSIGAKPISKVGALKVTDGVLMELDSVSKKGTEIYKKVGLENKKLFKQSTDLAKQADEDQKKLDEDAAKRKKELQQDIIYGSRQLTGELIDQLGLTEQETKSWQNLSDIIANAVSGNWVGAATGFLSQILSDLSGANIDESNKKLSIEEKRTKALDETNKSLERQLNLLQSLSGNDYLKLSAKQAEDLKKANAESLAMLQKSASYGDIWGLKGIENFSFQDFIKATTTGMDTLLGGSVFLKLTDEQQVYFDSILENTKQLADLMQSTFKETLGFQSGDVSDAIFTGIWDGLQLGKDSLGDFAESFGDLMKKALMQSITESFNIKLTEGWLKQFNEFMEGGLTDEERNKLEEDYRILIEQEQEKVNAIKLITDQYTTTASKAMTGSVQAMTEQTASMVAGQLTAMRVDIKAIQEIGMGQTDIMNTGIGHLARIEKNTNELYRIEKLEAIGNETNRILREKL